MDTHDHWMQRCLQLANNGAGSVAPNPMVSAVLVQNDRILAEGWHRAFGRHHAEVECLLAFGNTPVPTDATLYVNLEPCAHQGKTPPCVDLLIHRGVKKLVVGCSDPNPLTHDKGIARAREAGIEVITDVLRDDCRWLNRRFITSFEKQRPYIILKWAQSADGFLDDHGRTARISSPETDVLVHRWRAEEQAILVGSRTVMNDDPALTVRHVEGRDPLRVVLDRKNVSPLHASVFNSDASTLLFTEERRADVNTDQVVLHASDDPIPSMFSELHRRNIRSLLVEGGAELLGHFISKGLWDEARVITGNATFITGTQAPVLQVHPARSITSGSDRVDLYFKVDPPPAVWSW